MNFAIKTRSYFMPVVIALWASFLFLPFKGIKAASLLFVSLIIALPLMKMASGLVRRLHLSVGKLRRYLPGDSRYLALLLIPVAVLPFVAEDYIVDVAIISGIYIILALGLNVVVGFTGMLNLGFVAFYAIGAYSYALLNTRLGIGFWYSLPMSVLLTTMSGFLLAVPALRLKGDYLALVSLG